MPKPTLAVVNLAGATFTPSPSSVVVTGVNFPDALLAGSLGFTGRDPVLTTNRDTLSPSAQYVTQGLPVGSTVYAVGDQSAISDNVTTQITDMGHTVTRIAGGNQFETAAAVAATAFPCGSTTAVLATTQNDEVGLSGSFLATSTCATSACLPLFLTNANELNVPTIQALQNLGVTNVTIVGDPSPSVLVALQNLGITVTVIAGTNGPDLIVSVNKAIPKKSPIVPMLSSVSGSSSDSTSSTDSTSSPAFISAAVLTSLTRSDFLFALLASYYASFNSLPLLLTDDHELPHVTARYIIDNSIRIIIIIGNVGHKVVKKLEKIKLAINM